MVGSALILGLTTLVCIGLFALGIPIVLVFGTWVIVFHLIVPTFPMSNIAIVSFDLLQSFPWAAVPLFIITGDLIYEAEISDALIRFSRSITGWLPGSSANAALGTSAIFSAITGSNAATTASVGKAMFRNLDDEGYDDDYAAATIAAGGTLGGMIPPSILLIIYGITFNVSVPRLFLGGILPGFAMAFALIATNTYISKKNSYGISNFSFDVSEVAKSFWAAKLGFGTIAVLFGGIYSGIFTPTEAAAVAVAYILIVGVLTGKITSKSQMMNASVTAIAIMGVVIPIIIMSTLIQQNLVYLGIDEIVSKTIISLGNKWLMMAAMAVIMLITGSVLASVPNLVLTAPLLAGAASALGLSPVTWGIVFMISDMIGFITPPYGLNLYIISGITELDYMRVARRVVPHLIGLIIVWLVFFIFPKVNFLL